MTLERFLTRLSSELRWAVVFDAQRLAALAGTELIAHALRLRTGDLPSTARYVAFASHGCYAWSHSGAPLVEDGLPLLHGEGNGLAEQYAAVLRLLPTAPAQCIGVGRSARGVPVAMCVLFDESIGRAFTVLPSAPAHSRVGLAAVGVRPLEQVPLPDGVLQTYAVDLAAHLTAARLGRFRRTSHCVEFFLNQPFGSVDLRVGLLTAVEVLVTRARAASAAAVAEITSRALSDGYAMRTRPPLGAATRAYGDNIPLAFAAGALQTAAERGSDSGLPLVADQVRKVLAARRQDGGWAFQHGGLPTALDTALVALGAGDPLESARRSLRASHTSDGGYAPQLCGDHPGAMPLDADLAHWCQADFGTTCAVLAARGPEADGRAWTWVADRFEARGALFFSNPYLVDWMLALALRAWPTAALELRPRLLRDVLAGQNPDGSFGRYDRAFSTSLAVLTLAALDEEKRWGGNIRLAQLWLARRLLADGVADPATVFCSTEALQPAHGGFARRLQVLAATSREQVIPVADHRIAVTFYVDEGRLLTTSVLLQAMLVRCPSSRWDNYAEPTGAGHPCSRGSPLEYLQEVALPRYLTPGHGG